MIPELPYLSDPTMVAPLKPPYNRLKLPLSDYARGGVALLDSSNGINVANWYIEVVDGVCLLSKEGESEVAIETLSEDVSWISLAFDQNMHYNLAYSIGKESYLLWYDAERQSYNTDHIGQVSTPFVRMDDVRDFMEGTNDVILSYIKGGALCVRMQRDRYKVEYVLAANAGTIITKCGMNMGLRFQWNCS